MLKKKHLWDIISIGVAIFLGYFIADKAEIYRLGLFGLVSIWLVITLLVVVLGFVLELKAYVLPLKILLFFVLALASSFVFENLG